MKEHKIRKRFLALAMSICMICGMLPMSAHATETEHTCDWGEWTFNRDGTHTRVCNTDSTHIEHGNCDELRWGYDANTHTGDWSCYTCGGGIDYNSILSPNHVYSNDTDLTCDTCGYVRSVEGSLSITGDLPAATVGVAYSASLSYTGEVSGVVFWNATGLPDGLTVDYGTGTISGTPTTAGTYEVTISMGATGGGSASKNFTLTVNAEHTHVWSEEWSGTSDYHWHECIAEGCDLTHSWGDGKGEYGEHAYEITSDTHSRIDVGTGFGYHYGTCTICGRSGSKLIIAATRQSDATHHWYECPCGVTEHNEEHSFDDDADMLCDTCGYDRTPKSPASVTKAPEAITGLKFKEENGIEVQQILVTAGEAAGGTMVYRIDDGEWSTTIPARGQVRDYTVYYKVRGDSDHNDSAEGSVRVSIAKADAPIVSIPTQQHVYTIPTTGNSINIKSLLPELCAIMDEQSKVDGITGDFITNAVLNNGVLTYDTDAVNAPSTGTIKVKIVMRNYEDVTVTVNVELISAPHVHNFGTDWKSDGTNHWHECSCGAKADSAAHSGGTATCTEKAKCTACAVEYGELAAHTYGTEWKSDGTNHWHECTCGAKADEAAHNGGTASCTEKAKCTACGIEYGNLAAHTYGTEWKSDGTNHWHECTCGAKSGEAAHSGGTATCTEKAKCTACGTEYGNLAEHTYGDATCEAPVTCSECGATTGNALGHTDDNTDHTCDRGCGKTDMGIHGDTDTDHDCDYGCAVTIGTCEDTNKDHDCDYGCEKTFGTHKTASGKHTCTYCSETITTCKDDNSNHECDVCGKELTHDHSTEWKSDGTNHWHECTCGTKSDGAAHSGGAATCKHKAICTTCGQSYGEFASHNFENGKCTICDAADSDYVSHIPQTGDNSNMALWITLLFISGGAVITLIVYDRKRKRFTK